MRFWHCTTRAWSRYVLIAVFASFYSSAVADEFPLLLENRKSGISLSLSGVNGVDWAVERCYHDASIADQVVYLKSNVRMSLAHNDRNTVTHNRYSPHVIGVHGADGEPETGDEGNIYWKIDRDLQSHRYSTKGGAALPEFCVRYTKPLTFDSLTYDGSLPVMGTTGDNGGDWGPTPQATNERWAYGQKDSFGNEWHTLTYWDDDEPLLAAARVESHRQGASDGHCVFLCVNPVTPVLQLHAPQGQQFYTTPIKTYFVPEVWQQTTYLTGGVKLHFANLANGESVEYRVGNGSWRTYGGNPLTAKDLFTTPNTPVKFEYRCGPTGTVASRAVIVDPGQPAKTEKHGFMLWADEARRQAVIERVRNVQPFKKAYEAWRARQDEPATFSDNRGIWRDSAGQASASQSNAVLVALEGAAAVPHAAANCKQHLIRLARLQPIGTEYNINSATPAKDFLNELGQTIQQFGDAAVAYDLLIAHYRADQHPGGITPIEEIWIRDGLAKIAKSILMMRANWSATSGAGDTHWSHGYDLAVQLIAMAMPTYKSRYYGVSGADMVTVNDDDDSQGEYWNPYPYQGVTWFAVTTDPEVATPGHPGVRYPLRAEFLLTDDGWWTGPNNLVGDGSRYYDGALRRQLVDVKYGGLANAECRVELVEMHGYEAPFVKRLYLVDHVRRLKGLRPVPLCAANYIRRRLLMGGPVGLRWDEENLIYIPGRPNVTSALRAFNHTNNYASLPTPKAAVGQYLRDLNAYYNFGGEIDDQTRRWMNDSGRKVLWDGVTLALCEHPDELPAYTKEPNHAPIIKPLFKHVVRPGQTIRKDIIAVDLDDDELKITVTGLPKQAAFDPTLRRITWAPTTSDQGVIVIQVTASDGEQSTSRPFVMIVKADAPSGPIPAAPEGVTAQRVDGGSAMELKWNAPAGVDVTAYAIYRDGALWATTPAGVTRYADRELIVSGQHTRYHVSLYSAAGAESQARVALP